MNWRCGSSSRGQTCFVNTKASFQTPVPPGKKLKKKKKTTTTTTKNPSQAPQVAHFCNSSYLGGRDQKDLSSKPAQANSSQDLS
jgi:hypothetical protein